MEKNPLKPPQTALSGGLMTAGMKPQEISAQASQFNSANAAVPTLASGEE
jgi:hypothetical protein